MAVLAPDLAVEDCTTAWSVLFLPAGERAEGRSVLEFVAIPARDAAGAAFRVGASWRGVWRDAGGRLRAFDATLAPADGGRRYLFLASREPLEGTRVGAAAERLLRSDRCHAAVERSTPHAARTGPGIDVAGLEDRTRRLEDIIAASDAGTWEADLRTGALRANERWAGICGYTLGELAPLGQDTWRRLCHPDDLAAALAGRAAHLRGETTAFEHELRMRHRAGGWVWVLVRGRVSERAAAGAPERMSGIHLDITARKRVEAALERARARAEAASLAKSRFLAVTSHEIRTPLNGMTGLAAVLAERLGDPEDRRLAEIVVESGEALSMILDDVLDLSKIEAGKLDLERVAFRPDALAERLGARHAVLAQRKGLALAVEATPAAGARRLGDPLRVTQIVDNLVSNAVKFTETGSVGLAVDADTEGLSIEVSDTGVGIAPERQRHLFEDYAQGDSSTARRFGGTGLGMGIVHRLVGLMGGRIGLDSAPGQGTRVRVRLPLPLAEPSAAGEADGAPALATGLRVLVADDASTNRLLMGLMLERLGVEASVVEGGAAAVSLYAPGAFDAVLLDLSMPDLDGGRTLAAIRRADAAAGAAPVVAIAITADTTSGRAAACAEAGFDRHLPKPVALDRLRATLAEALDARGSAVAPASRLAAGPAQPMSA
ncbi:MAG: ATP-binding protein [Paracoccaceae bacterium]